jgi:PBP1b-binding outer membrane lipoprotein LpoB
MKKLWMIAGSALVMSACSDNVAEMNPAPAGNNDLIYGTIFRCEL